ncbi:PAAR domain-containing protein (plasmid) [Acinetobacter indicus]|uniref:PAAR domain-containing protein n=1 Tax=Acinetobacter indicus TaxID=756892 RepID=UPI000CEB58A4|nr:PAAR domain-containing protein [Acinetobacter indicus]AVH13769.1 PAAR domain-containing protein [Acinetobacter indicus]UNW11036.1 PAAR domain-containing protein [Acinetobacter indicus]
MSKGFGIHGSTTSHGGTVLSTQSRSSQMGNLFLRAGDGFACPKCKTWSTLIKSNDHVIFDGKAVAYVGDKFTCGATLMPKQVHVVGTSGGSSNSSVSNIQSSSQQNNHLVNNFNGSNQKYENYYIEQNRTEYVKFKNLIIPYDEDKKSWIGVLSQGLSGACEYIVTYILKGRELFITVSYIVPPLKGDAKITPFASVKIFREEARDFKLITHKNLEIGKGVWNTEKGKAPVGSATITLPEPNLSILKVEMQMGYEAKLDGGLIYPNPRYVTHTFTLNSAARRIS